MGIQVINFLQLLLAFLCGFWAYELWAKVKKQKARAFSADSLPSAWEKLYLTPAYDPTQDEHKIMSGEVESYFD